ncbi:MAG: hypothetical protein ACRBFS_12290 [Aureispira sp.]
MIQRLSTFSIVTLFFLLFAQQTFAQKLRFNGHYPLATPNGKESQVKAEYEKTLTAILGGAELMNSDKTPTKEIDREAYTRDNYRAITESMQRYAEELSIQLGKKHSNQLKKIAKAIRGNKFSNAIEELKDLGAKSTDAQQIFFIWKDYMRDKEEGAPWTDPDNIQVTRVYRAMLQYVSKNYDRPFGVQAEQGAIVADAAQALSNCMENPDEMAWKGESRFSMRQEDELRRLASTVSYYNWRRHDPISGMRSAHINPQIVDHVQQALFDIVRTTLEQKERWNNDPAHGANLLRLFEDTKNSGWSVDGERAKRQN